MKENPIDTVRAARRRGPLAGSRMLFVAPDDYPAFRVDLTELFSRHLVGRGLSIDWSLYRVDTGPAAIDDRGAERFILPERREGGLLAKLRNRISNGVRRWGLVLRAARGDYDVVQVRDYTFWGIPFLIAARIARKPFVFWMSYPVLEARWLLATKPFRPVSTLGRVAYFLHALAGKATFYRFLRFADHVVVQSRRMRERLEEKGVPRENMTPVEMGVTTERFNADNIAPSRDPRLTGRRVIAYVCSLHFGEPFDVALGGLAEARRRGHDAVLVAVGMLADHEREALAGKLAALGIPADAFISTGMLPLAEALSYVKAADLCLSPFQMNAEQEVATPTKLVEYLAMGRPVVASVHYDQSEVIGLSGTGLTAAFEGVATGEAIARILADREWAEEMGARGPAWVKANRDYSSLADRVERLYAGLLSEQASDLDAVAVAAE
jgi:glycosyltransferase involved in cell wall biosynthesis